LISFPTNSWLSTYLSPLFAEVATEEHHFGTQDILMAIAVIGGLVGIGIAFSKYIKQNQVPAADERSTVLQRCYTINIMLMKHMTLFSLKQLTVYQDS
jgi:predicted membrane-bound spermidine synthase